MRGYAVQSTHLVDYMSDLTFGPMLPFRAESLGGHSDLGTSRFGCEFWSVRDGCELWRISSSLRLTSCVTASGVFSRPKSLSCESICSRAIVIILFALSSSSPNVLLSSSRPAPHLLVSTAAPLDQGILGCAKVTAQNRQRHNQRVRSLIVH